MDSVFGKINHNNTPNWCQHPLYMLPYDLLCSYFIDGTKLNPWQASYNALLIHFVLSLFTNLGFILITKRQYEHILPMQLLRYSLSGPSLILELLCAFFLDQF